MNGRPGVTSHRRVVVVIPAYNEAQSISGVINDLRTHMPQADVLLVDDNSSDETAALARRHGVLVLSLACNLGVGGAVQTGYLYAWRHGYDVAVQFDGDGQHRANQIPSIVAALDSPGADLVVGSRFICRLRFRFSPFRYMGSRLLSRLVSAIIGRRVSDPTSGFRATSRRAISFFACHYPQTYLADTAEALVWAGRQGMIIEEVPVRMRQRRSGLSAASNLTGFLHALRIILAVIVDCIEPKINEERPQ